MRAMTYAELRETIDDAIEHRNCMLDFSELYGGDSDEDADLLQEELDLANQLRDEADNLGAAGLITAAERRLQCFLLPKWPDVESCEDAYIEATNR